MGKQLSAAGEVIGELPASDVGGRLRNIRYITADESYVKPAWLKFVIVKGVGGGGGGGGCGTTASAQKAMSAGGSGAGYFEKKIMAEEIASSEIVTIGAAGTAGTAGANAGGTGGTTSFGSHCSATGGHGGNGCAAVPDTTGSLITSGLVGEGIGGDLNISGFAGSIARLYLGGAFLSGVGGFSKLSGQKPFDFTTAPAPTGSLYGGGGCGTYIPASTAAKAGGEGAPGICIVEEYE